MKLHSLGFSEIGLDRGIILLILQTYEKLRHNYAAMPGS